MMAHIQYIILILITKMMVFSEMSAYSHMKQVMKRSISYYF